MDSASSGGSRGKERHRDADLEKRGLREGRNHCARHTGGHATLDVYYLQAGGLGAKSVG